MHFLLHADNNVMVGLMVAIVNMNAVLRFDRIVLPRAAVCKLNWGHCLFTHIIKSRFMPTDK